VFVAAKRDWTEARAKVEEEGDCRVCGAPGPDAAHLIPRSRIRSGPGEQPLNIVPLCRAHHTAFDAHQLDLLPYLTLSEQGYAASLVGLAEAVRRICGREQMGD